MGKDQKRKWGPGFLVAAAFIGPGTVTTASKSGASFGYSLLWVILFATIATIIFQEMAARLGTVTGKDLSQSLRESTKIQFLKWLVIALVLGAILVGNIAYQAGNITGATTALGAITPMSGKVWAVVIAVAAIALLMIGKFEILQALLIVLVAIMSALFLIAAIMVRPDPGEILGGFFGKGFQSSGETIKVTVALLGTTVVPYNLFLHSRTAAATWHGTKDSAQAIKETRIDTVMSVSLGGLVTVAIAITAAATFFQEGVGLTRLADVEKQLRVIVGDASTLIFCLGLAAAGLTSAITAPLAAGYATAGCLGWSDQLSDWRTRIVMVAVVLCGLASIFIFSSGTPPMQLIIFAQVTNGILLPPIAIFLVVLMNRKSKLKEFTNGWVSNSLSALVIAIATIYAGRQFYSVWGQLFGG